MCSKFSLDIAPWQKQLKSEYITHKTIAQEIEKSISPNNEAFKTLTSALSVVVTKSQMVAQASRGVAAGIQINADLFPKPHNQLNCNLLLNGRYNFSDFAYVKSPRTSIAVFVW